MSDRRHETRVPVEMWVEEKSDDATYLLHSANLSTGGLYLEHGVPQPAGTRMLIRFTLPGDDVPIETMARVVAREHEAELGVHLEFDDLQADAATRIERYISLAPKP